MIDPRIEDHLTGVELQLVEEVEQRERALAQGDQAEVARHEREIARLQAELVETAERAARTA